MLFTFMPPLIFPFYCSSATERNISNDAAAFLLLMVDQPSHIARPLVDSRELQEQLDSELRNSLRRGETIYELFNYLSPR